MGFVQLFRSIEDLLYEVMTWLVFYPRTLWRVVRHPVAMSEYSDQEQGQDADERYTDTLSPPLFLILSIVLAHGMELALHTRIDDPSAGIVRLFGSSEESLIIVRAVLFSIFPLVFAVGMVKRSNADLDRQTLRAPFFSQCFTGAVFAILVSGADIMTKVKPGFVVTSGIALAIVASVWYVSIQAIWFAEHLKLSRWQGMRIAVATFMKASLINAAIAFAVLY